MATKIFKSKLNIYEYEFEHLIELPSEPPEKLVHNSDLKIIGKPIPRVDGEVKVTGKAEYTFDKKFKNMVHAVTLRSKYPNAIIEDIDTSRAMKLKGVLKIISSKDNIDINWYGKHSKLFDKHVRYEGDEIACICAESEEIALKAKDLIEVKYKILPHSIFIEDSIKDNAPKIHEFGNIDPKRGVFEYNRGNYSDAKKSADIHLNETYTTPVVVHNPTEPHCSVVYWEDDELVVWDSTQAVYWSRGGLAKAMGLPEGKVRYIQEYMGGGFGAKLEAGKYSAMAALISKELNRPVKIFLDRKEMNLSVGNRPNSIQQLSIGCKKDGTITYLGIDQMGTPGAYPGGSGCSWPVRGMYKVPNVKIKETSVLTNAGKQRPFRAPGHVQGFFALESFMDLSANKLGIDPLEFRLKNYADVDPDNGNEYSSKFLKEAYAQGAEKIGWANRDAIKNKNNEELKYGIGMASQIWWGCGTPPAKADFKLTQDGKLTIHSGTQDIGTGTYTFITQIASEILDIPFENITVKLGDTKTCPIAPGSGGSLTAPSVSPAIYDGAMQLKDKIISTAAALLEVDESDIKYSGKEILSSKGSISFTDVLNKMDKSLLEVTGNRDKNADGYSYNSFGAQFAEVCVNVLTGQIKVNHVVASHDIGRVLNRKTLENQFYGGITQGLGFALMEERVIDDYTGKVLTTNLHDYRVPTIIDIPEIDVIIVNNENDTKISPVSVKGIGEPAIIPTAGAIANAVYHAIGVQIKDLPMTPDKVLKALYN